MTGRAIRIRGKGGVDVLELAEDLPIPKVGGSEVLISVSAAGLNRADILQRRGFYPAPPGAPEDIPGLEFAGTVLEVGGSVRSWSAGDRVMGICAGGGMATHLVAHERTLIGVPEGMSLDNAAAIPEVFLTAYDAVHRQAALRMGETVLIHAAGSGIGTAAIQLALAAGASPIGTSRSAWKLERCEALGLSRSICVQDGAFAKQLSALTNGRRADVILDTIGAAYLQQNIRSLAIRGRLVIIGLLGGISAEIPLGLLLARRATITGSVLRSRPLEEKAELATDFAARVLPGFETGALKPIIDTIMPMSAIREAHTRMERNEAFGKIVLTWAG